MTVIDILYPERQTPYGKKLVDMNMQKIFCLKMMGKIPDLELPENYEETYFEELKKILLSCLESTPHTRPNSSLLGEMVDNLSTYLRKDDIDDTKLESEEDLNATTSSRCEIAFNYPKPTNPDIVACFEDLMMSQGNAIFSFLTFIIFRPNE